ncbi:hypothetical protein [Cystobacter fuscus]|uniref:hypothetical protein n=1 Tax=Cystobacter fuscus TaxID=43 RepID=UPI002B2AD4B1|nr:hypothetical protein F0U63_20620 [Cystobacter fuscus]
MKMTDSTAKAVSDLMLSIGTQLNESIRLVQTTESEEVFRDYRLRVARLMGFMQDGVMNPLWEEHPHLRPPELR